MSKGRRTTKTREKKAALRRAAPAPLAVTPSPGAALVTVMEGRISVAATVAGAPLPGHSIEVDLARAVLRRGDPEFVFVQTAALDPTFASHVVVVRYDAETFRQRAGNPENRRFFDALTATLESYPSGEELEAQFDLLRSTPETTKTMTFRASLEGISRFAGGGAVCFYGLGIADLSDAVAQGGGSVPLLPVLQVTMHSRVLAGWMASWFAVIEATDE